MSEWQRYHDVVAGQRDQFGENIAGEDVEAMSDEQKKQLLELREASVEAAKKLP